ncbi:hypothetical protein tb265_30010 [Gemmatimonadetes bacterium T265]|nr:hypothetical protein tb265_30010 [Gemmatimonadetes bacterium T265]
MPTRMHPRMIALAGALALLAGAGCKDNPSAPSTDRVVAGSQQSLQTLFLGLVGSDRAAAGTESYYATADIWARDVIRPDPNEPRWLTEFYETPPDPSGFGGVQWDPYYVALRAAHSLLADPSLTSLAPASRAAASGFIRTLEAREYLNVVEYHDVNGAVIQGDNPSTLYPIRTKQAVLTYVSALLDSANADFTAAGDIAVPFAVPGGYQTHGDYSLVSNLVLYNRGLKGKAEVYLTLLDANAPDLTHAQAAATALNAALAGGTASAAYLLQGPYYEFTPSAPDLAPNPLVDAKLLLTSNFVNSINPADARRANIVPTPSQSAVGYTSAPARLAITDPSNTANLTTPLPILRNAELYLLRAQAEIALGNLAAATADINVVHRVEGGLPAYGTFATPASAIQALLYEYRYSFVAQGPQHLVALREYGVLNDAYISQPGIPTPGAGKDPLNQRNPIPNSEATARGGNVTPQP